MINDTISLFYKAAIGILANSNHTLSECCLIKLLSYILFEKYINISAASRNVLNIRRRRLRRDKLSEITIVKWEQYRWARPGATAVSLVHSCRPNKAMVESKPLPRASGHVHHHVISEKQGKGSPYSITERRVPELIPVLGSQYADDVSHKPDGRLPFLQSPPTLKRAATNFAAWWTQTQWVWTVCLRLLPDSVAAAIWTRALLRLSPAR